MDVNDLKGLNAEVKKRMDAAIEHVRKELSGLRSGRATVSLLDPVHVEAYGTTVPLNQVASLSVPEANLILAQPFDPTLMSADELVGELRDHETIALAITAWFRSLPQGQLQRYILYILAVLVPLLVWAVIGRAPTP